MRWKITSDPHADGMTGFCREMQEKRTPAKKFLFIFVQKYRRKKLQYFKHSEKGAFLMQERTVPCMTCGGET